MSNATRKLWQVAALFGLVLLAPLAADLGPPSLRKSEEACEKAKRALEGKNVLAAKEHCRLGLEHFNRLPADVRVAHAAFRVQFDMLAAQVAQADDLVEHAAQEAARLLQRGKVSEADRALDPIAAYAEDPRYVKLKGEIDRKLTPARTGAAMLNGEPPQPLYEVYEYLEKAKAEFEAKNIVVAKEACRGGIERFNRLPKKVKEAYPVVKVHLEILYADIVRADRLLEERTKVVRDLVQGRRLPEAEAALAGIAEYAKDPRYRAVRDLLNQKRAKKGQGPLALAAPASGDTRKP